VQGTCGSRSRKVARPLNKPCRGSHTRFGDWQNAIRQRQRIVAGAGEAASAAGRLSGVCRAAKLIERSGQIDVAERGGCGSGIDRTGGDGKCSCERRRGRLSCDSAGTGARGRSCCRRRYAVVPEQSCAASRCCSARRNGPTHAGSGKTKVMEYGNALLCAAVQRGRGLARDFALRGVLRRPFLC
jgi:hypothetical protein